MAKLIYSAIESVDGFVADAKGNFEWAAPDEEVHRFVNELERPIGTYLYGRRMYETMVSWETPPAGDQPLVVHEYAKIWQSADKIVYSRTLTAVASARTHLEREFDARAVARMKVEVQNDISIGGPHLAAEAMRAGLVDEIQLFLTPVVVGGGNRALPENLGLNLELRKERRFGNGTVYLRYGVVRSS